MLPAVERDGFWEGELNFRHVVTGAAVPVLYNLFPVRDADGRKLGYGTVTRDLTEQKKARQALQASEATLRAVLDTVPVGILFAEAPSGRIVAGNRRLEEIFRHPILPSPNADNYGEWVAFHEDGRRVAPEEYPLSRLIRKGSSTPRCAASTSAATVPGSGSRSPVRRCATTPARWSARSWRSPTSTPAAGPRNGRICSTKSSRTG